MQVIVVIEKEHCGVKLEKFKRSEKNDRVRSVCCVYIRQRQQNYLERPFNGADKSRPKYFRDLKTKALCHSRDIINLLTIDILFTYFDTSAAYFF